MAAAARENLEAYRVASVTAEARMVMEWNGQTVASLSRDFLNTNGAAKHAGVRVAEKDRTELAKAPVPVPPGDGLQPEMRLPPRPHRAV